MKSWKHPFIKFPLILNFRPRLDETIIFSYTNHILVYIIGTQHTRSSESRTIYVSHNRNNSPIAEQQADHGEEEACTDKSMPGRAEEPDTRGDEKRRE